MAASEPAFAATKSGMLYRCHRPFQLSNTLKDYRLERSRSDAHQPCSPSQTDRITVSGYTMTKVMIAYKIALGSVTESNCMKYLNGMKKLVGKQFDDESPQVQKLMKILLHVQSQLQ